MFFFFTKASIEAWKKRVDETVMTDDSARFGKYRRQLDELSAAITQLHRRYVMLHLYFRNKMGNPSNGPATK